MWKWNRFDNFNQNIKHWQIRASVLMASLWLMAATDLGVARAAPMIQEGEGSGIWPVLLPLVAASVAIERLIEIFWNYVDWLLLNVRSWEPAHLKTTQYVHFKSGTSLVFGVILGVLISNYTGMRLFDHLRPLAPSFLESVPAFWDVVITGIILGAGSKPAHDILGIVTQLKNFLGNSAIRQREAAGAAMAEGVLKLAQSDAQGMIDVPGVGPARLASPGRGLQEGDEGDGTSRDDAQATTDRYIDTLHRRTIV